MIKKLSRFLSLMAKGMIYAEGVNATGGNYPAHLSI